MTGINIGGDAVVQSAIFSHTGPLTALPEGATAAWSSSHPDIVSVVQDTINPLRGNIHGEAAGTASISCAVTNGTEAGGTTVTGSLDVPCTPPPPPTVTSVTVTQL